MKLEQIMFAHSRKAGRTGRSRNLLGCAAVAALAGVGAGCDTLDSLLSVEDPGRIGAETLDDPQNAAQLVDGAIADFECAFGHYITSAGLLGMELHDSQLTAAQWDYDRRTIDPSGGWYATNTCNSRLGTYTPLSTARWTGDDAVSKLQEWTDEDVAGDREALLATAANYSGYSHVLIGEGFCSAAFDVGPELRREDVFERAENRFTIAIEHAQSVGDEDLVNMALVGRARARLNLGQGAEAVADARQVTEGFVKYAQYSAASGRSENNLYTMNGRGSFASIYDAYRDLTFESVPDPRVPVVNTGQIGADQSTIMWRQQKYTSANSPIRIASWEEAQLIIAEVEGGQTAVDIINALHDQAGLPHFSSTDPDEILAHVLEERSREFFLESHHLGDVSRHNLPLSPEPGTPYAGKGGFYGDQRCFPLPDVERLNNPNI